LLPAEFWLKPTDLTRFKVEVIKHLPILIFGDRRKLTEGGRGLDKGVGVRSCAASSMLKSARGTCSWAGTRSPPGTPITPTPPPPGLLPSQAMLQACSFCRTKRA
jgi:hypothetical protein